MSYRSNPSWESFPWCRPGILVPFRWRQGLEVRLRSKLCATSTILVRTLTLCQERETVAGCGTPIRGPWAGLETCEPPPGGRSPSAAQTDRGRSPRPQPRLGAGRARQRTRQCAAVAESADAAVRCSGGRSDTGPGRARSAARGGRGPRPPVRRSVDTESMS